MRLWMIGCGNMGSAMLRRWVDSGTVAAADVDVVNRTDRVLPDGVRQARELPDGPLPDIVVLGVKPQQLAEVAVRFAARLADAPLLDLAYEPIFISASSRKREKAKARGWRIISAD